MEIVGEDFKILYDDSHNRFDLKLIKVINAKNADKRREEFTEAGYSMSMETCLKKIINFRINNKKDSLTISEYLRLFKEESKILRDAVDPYIQ